MKGCVPTFPRVISTTTIRKPFIYQNLLLGIFKSSCQIDITWFPFDDQECELKFGSWTYQAGALNLSLTAEKGDISDFKKNGVSKIISKSYV